MICLSFCWGDSDFQCQFDHGSRALYHLFAISTSEWDARTRISLRVSFRSF